MAKLKNILFVWKTVFSGWKYIISAVIISLAFFILNIIIQNYKTLIFFLKSSGITDTLSLLFILSIGFKETVTTSSFITIILISLLFGFFFSLFAFKLSSFKTGKNLGLLGTIGVFLGVAAPGCAACGVGLLGIFGVTAGALTILPFKGLEISLIAILILIFSIYKISKDLLECDSCKNYMKTKMKGGRKK